MSKGKKLTFLVTILCAFALLMSVFGITAFAASATADAGKKVTATTNATVKQGNTGYCYVYIDSLESLSSLNVAVHYDPDKISVTSSFNQVACSLYDSSVGESYVQYSYIFDGNGEDAKAQLFYFQYKVLSNAEIGGAYFDIVVNEAYDSSLNVADVTGSRCSFTIAETVTTKSCSISGTSSVTSSIKEEFELSYRLNTTGVASGSFVIRYDAELFEFVELTQGGLLDNKIVDVKSDLPGAVYVSFVGTQYASSSQLLNVKFKTIKNATETSQIKLSVTDFYDLDLNSISCSGYTTTVNVAFDSMYSEDAPSMTASSEYDAENHKVMLMIQLDRDSCLGAGDFVLTFDPKHFTYSSSAKGFAPNFFNINDKQVSEGVLKFSVISLSDIMSEETVLTVVFDTPVFCEDVTTEFGLDGSGLADSMTNAILLNFVDASLSIAGVGHDEIAHNAQAPTCTEIGWHAYDTCSRCDYTTYEEIPANGHSFVHTLCSVCGSKQPVYKSWDISTAGDGSLMANLYQNVVDGGYELEISGTGVMTDWTSTYNVPWYNGYRSQINCLIIENGVTSIGNYAFYGCTALTTVSLPNSTETIGNYAFYSCSGVAELSMGTATTTIGTYAFGYCSSLTSVTIPESVTTIGNYAFYNCKAIDEIHFNAAAMNDLANNNYVFYNVGVDGNGVAVTIGRKVTKIPAYLFYSTSNNIAYLPKIKNVIFEDNSACEKIGVYAFAYNKTIPQIVLPEGVQFIDNYAFYSCSNLLRVMMPSSVTSIGANAFYSCPNAIFTFFGEALPAAIGSNWKNSEATCYLDVDRIAVVNESLYVFFKNNTAALAKYYGSAAEYQVLETVEGVSVITIGSNAFRNNTTIERVVVPDSITKIDAYAFYNCSTLKSIIIPQSVTTIGKYAFYCAKLTIGFEAAELPASLGSYWNSDSGYYLNVEDFVIYDDATYVITNENTAILGRYFGTATEYQIHGEVNGAAVTQIGEYAFYALQTIERVTIPNGVTSIGVAAFSNCYSLTHITLPTNVLSIGNRAFYYCESLVSLMIPRSVVNIGSEAFSYCNKLTIGFASATKPTTLGSNWSGDSGYYYNVKEFVLFDEATYVVTHDNMAVLGKYYGTEAQYAIPESVNGVSVTIIGKNAFRNATALVNVSIPDTVTRIESYAFYYCTSLESITIPQNVTYIGNYAFYYTRALTEINFNAIASNDLNTGNYVFYCSGQAGDGIKVTIGAQVTKIPNCLFYPRSNTSYLPKITEFVFEEGSVCKTIGSYTFAYNTNLSSIILPEGVEAIGSYAFANTNISSIVIPNSVTTINSYAFNNCTNLAAVQMPSALTAIGAYAFYNCSSLTEIVIPDGVTMIDSCAFQNTGLKLVYICSDRIAYNANSATACGYLLNSVSSVVIRSDIGVVSTYIADNYTNTETITYQGAAYVIYSNNAHSWAECEVLVPFIACEQDGCIRYICSDCGVFKDVTTFRHDVVVNASKEPACLTVGWHEYHTCSRCDYTTYTEIPALGHRVLVDDRIWVDSITFENDANYPFVLKDGVYSSTNHSDNTDSYFTITALYDCTLNISYAVSSEQNYDKIIIRRNGVIVVEISGQVDWSSQTIELTAGDIVTINYHKDGSVANNEDTGWFSFTCGQTQIGELVPGPAADVEPTCTDAVVCHYCQAVVKKALGHDLINHEAKAPSCTEIGWSAYDTCSRCDYSTYVEIPATGHSYGEWVVTNEPTCLEAGEQRRDCENCDHYETATLAALGHDLTQHAAKAPTCTEIGWSAYDTCSRCDYSTYVEIAAAGHSYGEWVVTTAPTCLEAGEQRRDCENCDHYETAVIAATGHDLTQHAAKAPTCTEIGWNDYVTCSRCDYTTYVEIAALGHEDINHDAKAPTCTDIGWNAYVTCSRCEHSTYVEISANGHKFMDKICIVCGEAQDFTQQWDMSINGDGSVMAYAYAHMDGTYLLEVVGSGPMKNYSNTPFKTLSGKIDDIRIGDGVTSIGNSVFGGISIQGSVFIADSVTSIGDRAFYSFSGPRTITLPTGVTSIGNYAFYGSKDLIIILLGNTLPESLGSIWDYDCGHYLQPRQVFTTEDATYVIDRDGKAWLAKYCKNEAEFTAETAINGVPVTGIGAFAFHDKSNIITYTVPAEITSIERYAFKDCGNLVLLFESSSYPAGFTGYGYDDPPSYLAPRKVIQMQDRLYVLNEDGQMCLARYYGNAQNVTVEAEVNGLPVQHIGKHAFSYKSVRSVQLPDTIETIGGYAFIHSAIEQVFLPDSLIKIGTWAFFGTDLISVTIPENVTVIEDSVFSYCDFLKVVYVKSPTIAKELKSTSSCGNLCDYAQTVVIPVNVDNSWLPEQYSYQEQACVMDVDCIVYSNCLHDWQQTVITEMIPCRIDGVTQFVCSGCAVEKVLVAKCHDEILHTAMAPTCIEIGWHTYVTCSRCDYTTREEIAALGHDLTQHTAQAPTCTEIGWSAYDTCSRCDYSTYVEIVAAGHDHNAVVIAPTCTEQGYTTHLCHCGDSYVDSYAPATGHSYGEWVVTTAPTCLEVGEQRRDCENCDHYETAAVAALGHDLTQHAAKAPTCTEIGWSAYVTCSRCDYTTYVEISAKGHIISKWIIDIEATYEADGSKHKECTVCGAVIETSTIPMLTHSYVSVVTPPTCTERGYTTHTCSDCGNSYVDDYVPANGHTYGEWVEILAPKCEVVGTERRDCSVCDHYETRDVSATGHTESQWIVDAAATCTVNGSKHIECTVCEEVLSTQVINKLGHDEVVHMAKAPTCTAVGWDTYVTCSRCDYTTYKEIAATGHSYGGWIEITAPGCLTKGSERRDCNSCDHYETRDVAALGHNLTHHNAQAVTCTAIGWNAYDTCSHCDYTTYVEIPATGHTISDWIIDIEATYEADGSKHKECTVCGAVIEISTIPMLTHSYVSVVTPPTCTERGYTTHTCSDCGNSYVDDYVPANGHAYGEWVEILAPKCEVVGTERRDCSVCDHYETRDVSATGHTESQWIVDAAATCTVNGSKHIECTVCEEVLHTQVINKLGHDEVVHMAKAPTCTAVGWDTYVTCSRCDYTTYQEIAATGHSYGGWKEITAPDCLTKGSERRDCNSCDHYETRDVAALGHNITHHDARSVTCTTIGWNAYDTCSRCDYTTYVEIPAMGHSFTLNGNYTCDVCRYSKTPGQPMVEGKTHNSVVLAKIDGFEYSLDCTTWQNSNVFVNLLADTAYTFYQRVKESEMAFASEVSIALTVKTDKEPTYTVIFKNDDGTVLSTTTYRWGDKVTVPAAPTKVTDNTYAYTFAGWDKEVVACAGDATYTAIYTAAYVDYTVIFQNWDGTELFKKIYHYGDAIIAPANPTRPYDEYYIYTFAGWDKEITSCIGNTVYTATYTKTAIVVTSIAVTAKPNKLVYLEGDAFEADGMVITAYYNNGTSNVVTNYTVSGYSATVGTRTITVTYEGKTATFTVVVEPLKYGWHLDSGKWYYYEGGTMIKKAWRKDSVGWVYLGDDGAMLTNAWCTDSQGWCYVGADGYAVTNCWKKDSVGWIWLNANGSMTKNKWILDGGKWYYLNAGGYMVANKWMKDSIGWVYLGSNGAMLTNAWCVDSQGWCYVGANGYAVTNCWKKDSIGWIWLNANGSMTKNKWILDGGKWYYLNGNGYMVTGRQVIGGKTYVFNSSGVWIG